MSWRWRKRKRNKLGVSAETVKSILPEMVNPPAPPPLRETDVDTDAPYKPGLRTPEVNYVPEPYIEPTDKEIIEGLEFQDNYEAAFLIRDLKKQNMVLKGKLTKLTKKSNAYKEDLDNANAALKQFMDEHYGTKQS